MTDPGPVVLITGAAQRLGVCMAETLHHRGWRIIVHHRSRPQQARSLVKTLNSRRPDSAIDVQADLCQPGEITQLAQASIAAWNRLDGLINNASVFYPTPTGEATLDDWDRIMNTNLRAPFLLGQACLPALMASHGSIVNLIDIYSEQPLPEHPLYCASKSGLAALTRAWAKDLAPAVRVNGVSPGAILWPEHNDQKVSADPQTIIDRTPLKRTGHPEDIAGAVAYFLAGAPFVTGQILAVDGGRSLNM
ncbi:pteridine reductase [Marinobacter caseinilyticus]|uniref:pteridine reductase n=1 Tax=Marinobacter caseinilyticus TaxID=2692195 RepID=UPI001A949A20|nr:pteridine reductase [Marinobacter caseinilyticus]